MFGHVQWSKHSADSDALRGQSPLATTRIAHASDEGVTPVLSERNCMFIYCPETVHKA